MRQKELYAAPETEVLELHLESNVLNNISGGDYPTINDGGNWFDE